MQQWDHAISFPVQHGRRDRVCTETCASGLRQREAHLQQDTLGGKQRAPASAPVCAPGEAGAQRPQALSGSCDEDLILNNACSPHLLPKRGFEGASHLRHDGSPKRQASCVCRKPLGLSPRQTSVGGHPSENCRLRHTTCLQEQPVGSSFCFSKHPRLLAAH